MTKKKPIQRCGELMRPLGVVITAAMLSAPGAWAVDGTKQILTVDEDFVAENSVGSETYIDADGDGVPDEFDLCPDTPKDAAVDAVGCTVDGLIDFAVEHMRGLLGEPGLSNDAENKLNKALDSLHEAAAAIAAGEREYALDEMADAVEELVNAGEEGAEFEGVITLLLLSAQAQAEAALGDAIAVEGDPGSIAKAETEMATALKELAKGPSHYDHAIDAYAKVLKEALKALETALADVEAAAAATQAAIDAAIAGDGDENKVRRARLASLSTPEGNSWVEEGEFASGYKLIELDKSNSQPSALIQKGDQQARVGLRSGMPVQVNREIAFEKLVERGGVLYVKGETEPFTGTAITYYKCYLWDGLKRRETSYENGKRNGKETRYYYCVNGTWGEETYLNGKQHGMKIQYYKNGSKMGEFPYLNGKYHGVVIWYNEDGSKSSESPFKDGKKHGTEVVCRGKCVEEIPYKDGKRHGMRILYDRRDGSKIKETFYENGKSIPRERTASIPF